MTVQRMDNVGIVVEDLDAAVTFFEELGLHVLAKMDVEGDWVDHCVGLKGVRSSIAMLQTPDGHGKLELAKYHSPKARRVEQDPLANTLGLHRVMFAVEDIDDVVARLRKHGGEVLDEIVQYENMYRLCYSAAPKASLSRWRNRSADPDSLLHFLKHVLGSDGPRSAVIDRTLESS